MADHSSPEASIDDRRYRAIKRACKAIDKCFNALAGGLQNDQWYESCHREWCGAWTELLTAFEPKPEVKDAN